MFTTTGSFSIEPGAEPLPGYRLEKRIGSGGYGEVWKANAPGGLSKAIKIIHGEVDGDRAVRELRSLDRAKSLNHPFLLSIERIEIVDGHLLIVTELADATLRDRFEQCRLEGLEGIPRDELLEYMREAADALDYLFDSHALQHLDIKPENLLLRAKHVKVADFGLLKNLQESCASLVNGMTPKYSAPELFEGKPGRHSDQYSLAIVYHEMISGRLPFSGSNIASLASQHLHAAPDLSALAPVERFAVGKALSKDSQHRFPSCRAFVERLMHRSASMVMPDTRSPASGVAQDRSQTAAQKMSSPASDSRCHDGHTIETVAPEIRDLPRLLPPDAPSSFRPVLFVGIGGTGGRVLRRLRQLITDRLGEAKGLPALQFVYVDTDEDGLASVVKSPTEEGLDPDEILITPLRQTQDYRNAVVSTLDSISRRWIYNVPRSRRTQGLRALGRIAFLDNADALLDRIRRAVINATHTESVASTTELSGLSFSETDPRVFVVASSGGGTGSGMVLDAAYAIRQVLAECGFTDDYVCGFLTCSTASGAGPVGVAPANTFACLEELRYFAQPGCDFPGEPKCGLAGFRGDGATFRSTYLFDIPTGKTNDTTQQGFDQLAEYLFLSAVSPASALLDESRRLEREESHADGLRLRTAGICPLASTTTEDPAPFAEYLCRLLVRNWRSGSGSAIQSQVKPVGAGRSYDTVDAHHAAADPITNLGQAEMDRLGVTLLALRQRLVAVLTNKLGLDPRMYLRQVIDDSLSTAGRDQSRLMPAAGLALKRLRAIAGVENDPAAQGANPAESLAEFLRTQARVIGAQLGESIASWILKLADARSSSVDGARRAVSWVGDFVRALKQAAVEQVNAARRDIESSAKILASLESQPRTETKEAIAETLSNHAERDLSILIHEGIGIALRAVEPFVTATSDQLGEILKDFNQLADKFGAVTDGAGQDIAKATTGRPTGLAANDPPRMADIFASQQGDLIEELNQAIEEQFFQEGRGRREILLGGSRLREELAAYMRAMARRLVWRAYHRGVHQYLAQTVKSAENNALPGLVHGCLQTARPGLLDLGGAKRLLLAIPGQLDVVDLARGIEQVANERVSVSIEPEGEVKLCYEIEDLPWEGIQNKLIRQRHDCRELADRLHTRINVDWTVS
jgi:serine/threonine protein kinase